MLLEGKQRVVGWLGTLGLVASLLATAGCSPGTKTGTTSTPEEDKYYQNPIKEPPPEAGQIGGPPQGNTGAAPPAGGAPNTGSGS